MENIITSKKVTRWYLGGKGYSSKKLAYKKLAYQYLLDDVLGKNVIKTHWDDNGDSYDENKGRAKLQDVADAKATIHDLFMEKFPHEINPRCDSVCRKNYKDVWTGEGPDTEEDGFAFDSCKAAQQDWINQKAEELISADKV